jgi:putative ATPase
MADLFADDEPDGQPGTGVDHDVPLAERMRPRDLDQLVGLEGVLGPGTALRAAVDAGRLPSLVLWGPPGCGKTTLAACLARAVGAQFLPYSAVRVGVKELKAVLEESARLRRRGARPPILFLDEIHRFNKAQQDALLPSVEAGDVVLIGATTENPSFEVNAALLSRSRLVVLPPLDEIALRTLLSSALEDPRGLGGQGLIATEEALDAIARRSGGDARFALGSLELAARATSPSESGPARIDLALAERVLADAHLVYDRAGEEHFNLISALHKSLRNGDAQAGLYWLARMLEAGEDPLFVARRLVRFASEDVGLADPAALVQTNAAFDTVHRIGMPEAALALAQAAVYLAQAPKSNALYTAYRAVQRVIEGGARDPVPLHLRNAPTRTMQEIGYGEGYAYAHDDPTGVAPMSCLPERLRDAVFYRPTARGFEKEAADRLRESWRLARRRDRTGTAASNPDPNENQR